MAEFRLAGRTIWVAGHRGMVGSALVRRLSRENCRTVTVDKSELDLREPAAVRRYLDRMTPDAIIVAAARVGGIHANNSRPAEFLLDNLAIENAILGAAHAIGTPKVVFLASSCVYPRLAPQPIPEDALLTGPLEPTNEWYAIAKIAGIKMCDALRRQYGRDFISIVPTNLYGPGDNYDLEASHVIPALIRKTHDAKQNGAPAVTIWGTGNPRREFLHVDDFADACTCLLQHYSEPGHINVGSGSDVSIRELAELVRDTVGYQGEFIYDISQPDGMPRKLLDSARMAVQGWQMRIPLAAGLADAYAWFLEKVAPQTGQQFVQRRID